MTATLPVKDSAKKVVTLSIDKCPHGELAISVNLRSEHGHRLTPSKCCGRWDTAREWVMSKKDLECAAKELLAYAEHTK